MSVVVQSQPFAHGRFRRAFSGMYTSPWTRRGEFCVVKQMFGQHVWVPNGWEMTYKINKLAQLLANEYSTWLSYKLYGSIFGWLARQIGLSPSCTYADVELCQVAVACGGTPAGCLLAKGEWVTVEKYLPGKFQKFCNNYGCIAPAAQSTIMPAFMHWSWWRTQGRIMIADLQGVQNGSSFALTDPAPLSTDDQYGVTDMGVEGMCMFFLKHKCNDYCRGLPYPTAWDMLKHIPQPYQAAYALLIVQLQNRTSYIHELQIPAHIRAILCATLAEIAARQPHYN